MNIKAARKRGALFILFLVDWGVILPSCLLYGRLLYLFLAVVTVDIFAIYIDRL